MSLEALVLAFAVGVTVQPQSASAANKYWVGASGTTNNPTSGTWQTTSPTVWSDGTVETANAGWTAGDAALFGGAVGTYTVTVGGAISAANMFFLNSGYTLSAASAQTVSVTSNTGATTPQLRLGPGVTATVGTNVTVQNSVSTGLVIGSNGTNAGGTLNINGKVAQNSANTGGIDGYGTVVNVLPGGSLLGPTGSSSGGFVVGRTAGSDCTVNVNGGTFGITSGNTAAMTIGNGGTGTVNVVSGAFTMSKNTGNGIVLGSVADMPGTLNLNGGLTTTPKISMGAAGTQSTLNFNGGTLQANAANASFIAGLTRANVRNGGAIIDSAGFAITISQALLHSSISGDNATDGGLTKLNAGTLALAGTNTYTGPTTVLAGTLAFTNFGSISQSSALSISNATLDLTGCSNSLALAGPLALTDSTINLSVPANPRTNLVVGILATGGSSNTINVTSFEAYGNWPVYITLIKYSSLAAGVVDGNNNLVTLSVNLPTNGNLAGYLSNNTAKRSIDLVITSGDGKPSFAVNPPVAANRYAGTTVQLTATASRAVGYYQWRKDGVALSDNSHLFGTVGIAGTAGASGLTTTTLTISNLSSADIGNYDVVATNAFGSAVSTPAAVAVVAPVAAYDSLLATNTPRAVAYYRFNENSDTMSVDGLPAYDFIGGFDAVYGMSALNSFYGITGPQPWDNLPGFETGNGAVQFNYGYPGSTVTVSNGWPIINTNMVTLVAWIRPTGGEVANAGLIMNRGATVAGLSYTGAKDANGNYTLGYTWHDEAGTYNWDSKLVPPANQWSLVGLVVTPTNATIYLGNASGLLSAVHTYNHVALSLAGPIGIGYDSFGAPARGFNGYMDEVAVFKQALTSDQMLALLATGVGTNQFPPLPSALPSQTAVVGDTVQWTETPQGTAPFGYQWMALIDGQYVNLTDSDRISGSQSNTLTISNLAATDPTSYMVTVTNLAGSATAGPGNLTILTTRPVVTLTAGDASGTSSFAAAGHWSDNSAPAAVNDYVNDSWTLRTPADVKSYTFAGHSLTLRSSSSAGVLALKGTTSSNVYTFGTSPATGLILDGGWVGMWVGNAQTVAGYITLTANGGSFDPQNSSPMTITAQISGVGCLKADANGPVGGRTVLSAVNTYTGGTVIDAADTLQLAGAGTLGSTTAPLSIINTNNKGYGTLDLNGTSQTIGNLSGTGGTILNSSAASSSTLIIGNGNTGGGNFAGSFASGAGILGLTKVGTGTITLSGTNSYTGPTLISGGTLALSGAATLSGTPVITVAQNATLDVSGLASPFSLGAGQALAGSGPTCTVVGNVNLDAGSLVLNYSGAPALTVGGGTFSLNNNAVVVTNLGAALPNGTYKLVAKGAGTVSGSVAGSPVTVAGAGVVAGSRAALSISGGELYLTVASAAPPVPSISRGGNNLTVTWAGSGITLLTATNLAGPWVTNSGASSPYSVTPTNAQMFFRLQQ